MIKSIHLLSKYYFFSISLHEFTFAFYTINEIPGYIFKCSNIFN